MADRELSAAEKEHPSNSVTVDVDGLPRYFSSNLFVHKIPSNSNLRLKPDHTRK